MPKMNGLEMAMELRKDEWGKRVHIIILTNSSGTEKVADALETGVYQYLVKSDTPSKIYCL
jgi:CheY-like chemotaxis protein